jgi:hypothetical protein
MTFPLVFHPNIRSVIRHSRAIMMRSLVQDEVKSHSSMQKEWLTPEQSRRVRKINEATTPDQLAKLYTKEGMGMQATPDDGGLDKDRARKRIEELASQEAARIEAEYEARKAAWAKRPQPRADTTVRLGASLLNLIPAEHEPPQPTVLDKTTGKQVPDPLYRQCSYCREWVHESRITHGSGPLYKIRKIELSYDPIYGIEIAKEKIIHTSNRIVACPACCLNVRDTKFPASKG